VISAMIAGVRCAASHAIMLALDVAFLAPGDTIRPALLFYVFETCIIIWKFAVKVGYRIAQICCIALFLFLLRRNLRDRPRCPSCFQGIFSTDSWTAKGSATSGPLTPRNTVFRNSSVYSIEQCYGPEDYLAPRRPNRRETL